MPRILLIFLTGMAILHAQPAPDPMIEDLIRSMTIEEKAGQLNLMTGSMDVTGTRASEGMEQKILSGQCGGVFNVYTPAATRQLQEIAMRSRLKIPLLFGYDVIHGHRTIFPIPLGLSCSWNPDLIRRTARVAATEAAADGLNWTFSPMVDISHDARWGRVAEGSGEDPWLGSEISRAMVQGYQAGDLTAPDSVAACVKHLALYGAVTAGRDYNTVDMSRRLMEETYFPPYRAAVAAGVRTAMTSFNDIDGIPATGNRWLLHDILRQRWGFDGLVVTDYSAIEEMIQHSTTENGEQAARQALQAGVDMDMVSELYLKKLPDLVKSGAVSEEQLDEAVRRVLTLKRDLGLFKDPFARCDEARAKSVLLNESHRDLARQAARESIVLLKNQDAALPLKKSPATIALIGPLAANRRDMLGCWAAAGNDNLAASPLDGVRKTLGTTATVLHARGSDVDDSEHVRLGGSFFPEIDPRGSEEMLAEAEKIAAKADTIILVLGESWEMNGEAASRADIRLPECQRTLASRMLATGKPCILIVMSGRPLDLSWESSRFPAIVQAWALGTEGGNALADVLFGDFAPVGKLTMSFPRAVGQLPMTYRAKNTGRPANDKIRYTSKYIDIPNDPLYPFGHGLTYGTFKYGPVKVSSPEMPPGGSIQVSAEITNTSNLLATETLQLYLRDIVSFVTRPLKELRGYQRVTLQPGETKTVTFEITDAHLSFPGPDFKPFVEPGEFDAMVGPDSARLQSVRFKRLEK
ncbi:MAG: beta-glucosidase BglX [Luteolibacter sp.]